MDTSMLVQGNLHSCGSTTANAETAGPVTLGIPSVNNTAEAENPVTETPLANRIITLSHDLLLSNLELIFTDYKKNTPLA